jgi:hypothetical protein
MITAQRITDEVMKIIAEQLVSEVAKLIEEQARLMSPRAQEMTAPWFTLAPVSH